MIPLPLEVRDAMVRAALTLVLKALSALRVAI